jgi:hypothetical protein
MGFTASHDENPENFGSYLLPGPLKRVEILGRGLLFLKFYDY